MKSISGALKPGGVLYIADFALNSENPLYKKRYDEGISKGYEPGAFDAVSADGTFEYVARHYSPGEMEVLAAGSGLSPLHLSTPSITTQSGNVINGILMLARK